MLIEKLREHEEEKTIEDMYMCMQSSMCVHSDMALHVDVYSFALCVLIGCMCICVYIQVICSIYTHV